MRRGRTLDGMYMYHINIYSVTQPTSTTDEAHGLVEGSI